MRKVTRLAFPGTKYTLGEAERAIGALAQLPLARQPFDVIVLDLQMPDMNGVDFIRAMRQRPVHASTPIVSAAKAKTRSS